MDFSELEFPEASMQWIENKQQQQFSRKFAPVLPLHKWNFDEKSLLMYMYIH